MKKVFLFFFFVSSLLTINTYAFEQKMDGYFWRKQSLSWKLGYLDGLAEWELLLQNLNIRLMALDNDLVIRFYNYNEYSKASKYINRFIKIIDGFSREYGLDIADLRYDQVIETIDKFYKDPRVRSWKIIEIMPLVRGRLKGGWTEKDIDEVISFKIKNNEYREKLKNATGESEKKIFEDWKKWERLARPKVLDDLIGYFREIQEEIYKEIKFYK